MRSLNKRLARLGIVLIAWGWMFGASSANPARAGRPVDFDREIRPILSEHCYACHGPDQKARKADLRLDRKEDAFRDRSGYAVIVPAQVDESELIQRISSDDPDEVMPPPKSKKRLNKQQIDLLRRWVAEGAKWDGHWSYALPASGPPPPVNDRRWPRNLIDHFVLARLEREGLHPSPEADRATLIRRVSLDLIGLPPTPGEVDAFENDRNPGAYERVVDRLLASPHHGERQARPWLDQARYADTNGYEKDGGRSIWPYRDWVIRAFNRDLPFDRFTVEQIAGDLLPDATTDQRVATGFHRNTVVNTEGGIDDEEFRVAAVVDRVNTTMQVWMGTTIGCAQCHDHKYDPFAQKEYFQLFAFFNNTADGGGSTAPDVALPSPEQTAKQGAIRAKLARWQAQLDQATKASAKIPTSEKEITLKPIRDKIAALKKQETAIRPATTMVMRELPQPRATTVLIRGSHNVKGEPVSPAVPKVLHPLSPDQPLNRLGLARWLVDPRDPLVGRVIMNRLWAQDFGRGIVETSEDFGVQGEPPSHPELLAWLAKEFTGQSWSLKAMHRLIVTSATYRQSSRVTPDRLERDPYNRLFSRGPRFRMEAEMVRDQALAVSGLLKRAIGGPSVFPYQPEGIWFAPYSNDRWIESKNGNQFRRGLYTFWRRSAPYPAFITFDAPSREVSCERRARTNTPLQALATLNDPAFVQPAAALARRILAESKGTIEDRAVLAFRLVLARKPLPAESGHLVELYHENLDRYRRDPAAALATAMTGLAMTISAGGLDKAELAAWTVVANVLLNLDETLTKG
ncbi:MAG: PSD1 and planctomycete cytochrome C domain-containing protein [Isosphaerales bacterium]